MARRKTVEKYSEEASVRQWEKLFIRLAEQKGGSRFSATDLTQPPLNVHVETALFHYNNNDNNKFIAAITAVASHAQKVSSLRISAVVTWLCLMAKRAGEKRSASLLADKSFGYISENNINLASLIVLMGTQSKKEIATDEFELWMASKATSLLEKGETMKAVGLLRFGAISLGKRGEQYNLLAGRILDARSK